MRTDKQIIPQELREGEIVLWSGQPHVRRLLKTHVAISLIWIAIMVFLAVTSSKIFIFVLFFAPFAPVSYMILRRFKMKNTYYAVTNKRVLSVVTGKRKKVASADLCDIECDHVSPGYAGIGTIVFGSKPPLYQNSILAFSNIIKAEKVYDIYKDAKSKSKNS